jgi:hypothetical protein
MADDFRFPLKVIEALLLTQFDDTRVQYAWAAWANREGDRPVDVDFVGAVSVVEVKTEYDGDGDAVRQVLLKVTHPNHFDRWFRKYGAYDSYSDERYDGAFEEVEPEVVQVTKWKAVK